MSEKSGPGSECAQPKQKKCDFARHLGGSALAMYLVMLRIVKGRKMSELTMFSRRLEKLTVYDKNTCALAINALVAAGWLDRYPSGKRFRAPVYSVNLHDEWAARHPGGCEPDEIVPVFGTKKDKSVLIQSNRSK